ncbi:unnamed protein product, partial [Musa textilis]
QASNRLRSTWWQDRGMRLPWLDEVLLELCNLFQWHVNFLQESTTCMFVGMFCVDAIDEKGLVEGSHLNNFLDLIVCISHEYLGCNLEPGFTLNCRSFRSTSVSRDASYRHQANLDQGGRKWNSNQVW